MEAQVEAKIDAEIDVTGETCPMTFVRTRLALDRLSPGQILRVTLRGEEPRHSVPLSAARLGHAVLSAREQGDVTVITIQRR